MSWAWLGASSRAWSSGEVDAVNVCVEVGRSQPGVRLGRRRFRLRLGPVRRLRHHRVRLGCARRRCRFRRRRFGRWRPRRHHSGRRRCRFRRRRFGRWRRPRPCRFCAGHGRMFEEVLPQRLQLGRIAPALPVGLQLLGPCHHEAAAPGPGAGGPLHNLRRAARPHRGKIGHGHRRRRHHRGPVGGNRCGRRPRRHLGGRRPLLGQSPAGRRGTTSRGRRCGCGRRPGLDLGGRCPLLRQSLAGRAGRGSRRSLGRWCGRRRRLRAGRRRGRSRCRRRAGRAVQAGLQVPHPLGERFQRPVLVGLAEPDQSDLDVDPGIGRLPHVDQSPPQRLQRSGDGCGCHAAGQVCRSGPLVLGQAGRRVPHGGQEGVAQPGQRHLADGAGIPAPADGVAHAVRARRPGRPGHGPREWRRSRRPGRLCRRRHHPLEGGERVSHRAAAGRHRMVDGLAVGVQPASATTYRRWSAMMSAEISPSSNTWQRPPDGLHHLVGSVVASTQVTWAGGSSRVLSSAFSAPAVSMWTSSSRYTLARPGEARLTRSSRARMCRPCCSRRRRAPGGRRTGPRRSRRRTRRRSRARRRRRGRCSSGPWPATRAWTSCRCPGVRAAGRRGRRLFWRTAV